MSEEHNQKLKEYKKCIVLQNKDFTIFMYIIKDE